eukprot:c15319_g1_i1.p1 GENE.c15319_g1_i1~~c15319_g1_i1.p1  ORF type:complete len:327 (+),score=73.12 c15319_g1_i1:379-1359(+)
MIADSLNPVVTVRENFDHLGFPADHSSRSHKDSFFLSPSTTDPFSKLLRTHTSAHQTTLMTRANAFLLSGDVYRRDSVDASHYPVFHQMEGVRIFTQDEIQKMLATGATGKEAWEQAILSDLKNTLETLAGVLFPKDTPIRWVDTYFPFTHPSAEMEVYFRGDWLEVLGCGVIHPGVMVNGGRANELGWAFGLGLERLAMVLFSIPDIRLFWTQDERFVSQFRSGEMTTFKPYSKFPECYKDVTFFLPTDGSFHDNDMHELVREVAGDLVERVQLLDQFRHPSGKQSHCYRITYRSMDRVLTNAEIDVLQFEIRDRLVKNLRVELR